MHHAHPSFATEPSSPQRRGRRHGRLPALLGMALCAAAPLARANTHSDVTLGVVRTFQDGTTASAASLLGNGIDIIGHAMASANIDGTLRVGADGRVITNSAAGPYLASSTAYITDVVTFHGPGSTVPVTMTMDIDGTYLINGTGGGGRFDFSAGFIFDGCSCGASQPSVNLTRYYNSGTGENTITGSAVGDAGTTLDKTLTSATVHLVMTAVMPISAPLNFSSDVAISLMHAAPDIYTMADFSHTAHLAISLPAGYSYASASGAFLVPSAVPEPRRLALTLAGMAAVAACVRRRRHG